MSALPVEQSSGAYLEVAYQEQETTTANVGVEQGVYTWLQYAYQALDVVTSDVEVEQISMFSQVGYQELEVVEKDLPVPEEPTVTDTTPSGGFAWVKVADNVLRFAFVGKAYLFDGERFEEFGSPGIIVFPAAAQLPAVAGGLTEEGTPSPATAVYGTETYVVEADRDYLAMVIPGEKPVQLVDQSGAVKQVIKGVATVPLLTGWKLVSRSQFIAMLQRI